MENRKIVSTPASAERSPQAKGDDFDPQVSSGGPVQDDEPHGAYDIDAALSSPPPGAAGK
jgi:hypothetical protein